MDKTFQLFKNSLVDSTICPICLNPIVNAVMCPTCNKFCCENCIIKWINLKGTCPQCRRSLRKTELVHIKLIDELAKYTKMFAFDTSMFSMCPLHNEIEKFICLDCQKSFCSDCLIFGNHNTTHLVCQSKDLQNNIYKELIDYLLKLDENEDMLSPPLENKIKERIKELKAEKEEKLNYLKDLSNAIDKRYNEYIQSLEMFAKDFLNQKKSLKTLKISVRDTMKSFLTRAKPEPDIADEVEVLSKKIESTLQLLNNRINYVNNFITPLEITMHPVVLSHSINKITEKLSFAKNNKEKDSLVYTSHLFKANFLTWQILFYPNGYGAEKGKNIAIFFGLKEGDPKEIYTYTYSIELINTRENGKNFKTNEFTFDFQNGSHYTGVSNLYLIKNLSTDGFISKENTIEFRIYLKPKNLKKEVSLYIKQIAAQESEKSKQVEPIKHNNNNPK